MSTEKQTGGSAFPVATWDREQMRYIGEGMTLRDYFAAKAMQGLLADLESDDAEAISTASYLIADAMLKAREL